MIYSVILKFNLLLNFLLAHIYEYFMVPYNLNAPNIVLSELITIEITKKNIDATIYLNIYFVTSKYGDFPNL